MPLTHIFYPILAQFFSAVEKNTGMPIPIETEAPKADGASTSLPKGVVLGPDGKPCRSCTSSAAWTQMMKKATKNSTSSSPSTPAPSQSLPPTDCPPDVEFLGRSSWTLLHTMAASYPESPSSEQQRDVSSFLSSFSRLYPCHWCATDFQAWMGTSKNAPRVSSRREFSQWLCEAHNEVNKKLGKSEFDCGKWEERWRTGWKDGRCD